MKVRQNSSTRKRVIALDIMKTISIILMILIHVIIMYGSPQVLTYDFVKWWAFATEGIGAPAFIFIMGVSIVLSDKKDPIKILSRGILLFLMGYVLNVLKFYPTIEWFKVFPYALFIETQRINNSEGLISLILIVDILQFSAIAYIICGFLHLWFGKLPVIGVLLSLPFFLFATSLYEQSFVSSNYFLQIIYGKNYQVYFPLFPWLGFALFGMSVGSWITVINKNQNILIIKMLLAGIIFIFLGIILIRRDIDYFFGSDYYHRGAGALAMYCGQLLTCFPLYHFISKRLPKWMESFFTFCGRNVTVIYVIQWILIYWCWYFIPYGSQPLYRLWQYFLLFTFISLVLAALWEHSSLYQPYVLKLIEKVMNCPKKIKLYSYKKHSKTKDNYTDPH